MAWRGVFALGERELRAGVRASCRIRVGAMYVPFVDTWVERDWGRAHGVPGGIFGFEGLVVDRGFLER